MKKYITEDGEILEISSNLDLVNQLKNLGRFTEQQTPQQYIKGFSERYKEYAGVEIRFDSIDNFVADLIDEKYLKNLYTISDDIEIIGTQEKEPTLYYIECPNCKKKIIENTPVCYYCETEF